MLLWKRMAELVVAGKLTLPNGTTLDTVPTINAGATRGLTTGDAGKIVNLNALAGSVVTLPRAVGSGRVYRFVVSVLATSNSHVVKVGNTVDGFIGGIVIADTDTAGAASSFFAATAGTDDTITLNRSTTGSVVRGESIEITDLAPGVFAVRALLAGTGAVATPFSATV